MSPRTAAAAVARSASTALPVPARRRARPIPGPARRKSGGDIRPRTKTRRRARRTTAQRFDVITLLDRLLRGPLYIAVVGLLLAGIVFFNVGVLQLNHGIASTDARATALQRENAALTRQLARLASSERIQRLAIAQGLLLPEPGDVRYLRANPGDAGRALRVMTAPDASSATPGIVSQVSQPPPGTTPATATTTPGVTPPATPAVTPPSTGTTTAQPTPSSTPPPASNAATVATP